MRIILTGGGTGGHIYPAVAIGQAIKKVWPNAEFLYVGTKRGLETKIVPAAGYKLITLDIMGWERKVSLQALKAGWKAIRGLQQATKIVKDFKPQLVIGTGGYVCLPVVWAAARQGVPTLIHEQNAMPGLTNKFLSRRVDGIMLTFPQSKKYFSQKLQEKLYVTGLPVRPAILEVTKEEGLKHFGLSKENLTIVSVGGSRGAKSINEAMLRVCVEYAAPLSKGSLRKTYDSTGRISYKSPGVQIIHITGTDGYTNFLSKLQRAGINMANNGNIIVRPYIHEMEYALACADLCIARAGAAFLSEMTARGIPGILIPYPYATENHQEYNARSLVEQGAAQLILDRELTGEKLLEYINNILFDENKRNLSSTLSLQAGKPEAIEKILQVIKKTSQ